MANPILKDKNLNGLVLVGGKSSRMGTNKAFLDYHSQPQINYLTNLLTEYCSAVHVSAKQQSLYSEFKVIEDKYDFEGPLNGILSAFNYDSSKAWLVVACDMPFIDDTSIIDLLSQRDKRGLATCYQNIERKPEPLFSVYESKCYPLLTECQKNGQYSPRTFLIQNNVKTIDPGKYLILENVNSKEEFDRIKNNLKS